MVTGGAGFIGSHVVRLLVNKYPGTRILNVDANTIFYSAPKTETPKLDRLMRLVSTCTEYEAHELIRIVNDILNIMRHSENENEENAI